MLRRRPLSRRCIRQFAVISVDRHNTFGHPGPSTLSTLARFRAMIYRTDSCGAFRLKVDRRVATTMLRC